MQRSKRDELLRSLIYEVREDDKIHGAFFLKLLQEHCYVPVPQYIAAKMPNQDELFRGFQMFDMSDADFLEDNQGCHILFFMFLKLAYEVYQHNLANKPTTGLPLLFSPCMASPLTLRDIMKVKAKQDAFRDSSDSSASSDACAIKGLDEGLDSDVESDDDVPKVVP